MLFNKIYKILSNVLFERLRSYAEKCIGMYQVGFRTKRFTIDQIFTLRQILEKTREYNIDTYHLFIDFRSSYNNVKRTKLYQAMSDLQISPEIIRMVQ